MLRGTLALVLAACSGAAPPPAPPAHPAPPPVATPDAAVAAVTDPELVARDVVAKIVAHEYPAVAMRFAPKLRDALPADKLQAVWTGVEGKLGAFDQIELVTRKDTGGSHVMKAVARFANARLEFLISVDDKGEIGGFYIRPGDLAADWKPPAYAKVDAIEERSVTVGKEPALPGTLTLPKGDGPFPAIVLVHGSGPNDADETIDAIKVFKDLALGLASQGIAVLRYDKRTRVSPAGVRTQKEEVDDAAHAAVALLAATPKIDKKRIVLLGHSQGGYLAPRIAKADPAIRGLVIFAGPTRSLQDSLLAQVKYLAGLAPGDAKLAKLVTEAEQFKQTVEKPALGPHDTITLPLAGSIQGDYFLEVRDYHPDKVAAGLKIPIAVMQGERDYQVTLADDFAAWKAALGKRKDVKFYTYPAGNHAFVAGTGVLTPDEYARPGHVEPKVIDDLAHWILALPK